MAQKAAIVSVTQDTNHHGGASQFVLCHVLVQPHHRFHFTTGRFPFEGENVYKLFGVISAGVFEMPPDLSPLLKDLLRGMYLPCSYREATRKQKCLDVVIRSEWFVSVQCM